MILAATRYAAAGASGGGAAGLRYELISGAAPTYLEDAQTGDWELVFLSSCKIKLRAVPGAVDLFAVGGGAKGGDGYASGAQQAHGGAGGKGGACRTETGLSLSVGAEYQVDVGSSGQSSAAFGLTAASGDGAEGGQGASATYGGGGGAGTGGSAGSLAFGRASASAGRTLYEASLDQEGQDPVTLYFGAGGGGGGAWRTDGPAAAAGGSGGATGGGDGGRPASSSDYGMSAGSPGRQNTGAGGGGGGAAVSGYLQVSGAAGGLGGSGIVIIRNAR